MKVREYIKGMALISAEMIGGAAIVGVAQNAVNTGICASFFNLGLGFSVVVGALCYKYIYSKMNTFSVPEASRLLFGKHADFLVLSFLVFTYIGILAVEIAASGSILSKLFGINARIGFVLSSIIILLPALGGFHFASWWNVFLAGFLFLVFISSAFSVLFQGGVRFFCSLPPSRDLLMWLIFNPLSFAASQPLIQSAAWCEERGISSFKLALVSIFPITAIGVLVSLVVMSTGANAGKATLIVAAKYLSKPFSVLIPFAIILAIFTTAPVILIGVCTIFIKHLGVDVEVSGRKSVRYAGVFVMIVSLALSFKVGSIVKALSYSFLPRAFLGIGIILFFLFSRFTIQNDI